MHFDPAASDDTSTSRSSETLDPLLVREEGEEVDRPVREGLPPAFRMRHGRHYVEHLMGDAPIRTVREIAVADLEAPVRDEARDLEALVASIRELGVLEPLLVTHQGERYRVIAGEKRLHAARVVGLRSLPCLVHDVNDEVLQRMREAVSGRPASSMGSEPEPSAAPEPGSSAAPDEGVATVDEAGETAAANGVGNDALRQSVLADLATAEAARGRCVGAASDVLSTPAVPERTVVSCTELAQSALGNVQTEARLRGVPLDVSLPESEYRLSADAGLLSTALDALLHAAVAWAHAAGSSLQIRMRGTSVRPALIVEVVVAGVELDEETASRFFDEKSTTHPAGPDGSVLMACVRRVARLHGGRADLMTGIGRSVLTFVVPRPLT